MSYFQSIVLGLIQGLSEFLPISSSAHLVILPWVFQWPYQGLTYDIALHWGTLLAVIFYFWRDWVDLIRAAWVNENSQNKRLFWLLVLATIPAGLAGLVLEDYAEHAFREPPRMACALIAFGMLLGIADRMGRKTKDLEDLDFKTAMVIGLAQALAIVPGVSRSGITITAALFLGLARPAAARFSFLMSTPIIAAAGLLGARKLTAPALTSGPFWVGVLISALSGAAAIGFLMNYLKKKDVWVFAFYRLCLGLMILTFWYARPASVASQLAQAPAPDLPQSSSMKDPVKTALERHVRALAGTIGERNPYKPEDLHRAEEYIIQSFKTIGQTPQIQEFGISGVEGLPDGLLLHNIFIEISGKQAAQEAPALRSGTYRAPEAREAFVVGAHYDSAPGTPGADDNASGVAVLLELGRLLKEEPSSRPVILAAFAAEEPPFFGTKNMGSWHFAQSLKRQGRRLEGMISLEMLGYYNDHPGSQAYPPFLSHFFPDQGDFVGLVSNLRSRALVRAFARIFKEKSDFPFQTASLPGFFAAIHLSDHWNFWRSGYRAAMLTDTAFFRNPHYHEMTDTPDKLDYERLARLTRALAACLTNI